MPLPCPLSSEPHNIPEMTEQKWLPLFVKSGRLELSLGRTDALGYAARSREEPGSWPLPEPLPRRQRAKQSVVLKTCRPSTILSHGAVPFLK